MHPIYINFQNNNNNKSLEEQKRFDLLIVGGGGWCRRNFVLTFIQTNIKTYLLVQFSFSSLSIVECMDALVRSAMVLRLFERLVLVKELV